MTTRVTIVDYGLGNLLSVRRALEHCGAEAELAGTPSSILKADRLLLPGVGAFGEGMHRLRAAGLDEAVREYVGSGNYLLGICLGMQLLLDSSEEFGGEVGLGLIPGEVVEIPVDNAAGEFKIPHVGWSDLVPSEANLSWNSTLLESVRTNTAMYFVHSFMSVPNDIAHRLADCIYGGIRISAVIGHENVWGTQFHPEKSGEPGLSIIRKFLAL